MLEVLSLARKRDDPDSGTSDRQKVFFDVVMTDLHIDERSDIGRRKL
jgi:hypothetical protein